MKTEKGPSLSLHNFFSFLSSLLTFSSPKICAFQILLSPKSEEEPRISSAHQQPNSLHIKWTQPIQSLLSLIFFNLRISLTMLKLIPLADMEEYSSLSYFSLTIFPIPHLFYSLLFSFACSMMKSSAKELPRQCMNQFSFPFVFFPFL